MDTVALHGKAGLITNTHILEILRTTCSSIGGKEATFRFDSHKIGNKSIRSGAALVLFINNISTAKIMIMGRWSSDAFLAYIQPQILEWTNNMRSCKMISMDSFFDVQMTLPPRPHSKSKLIHHSFQWPSSRNSQALPSLNCSRAWKTIPRETF